MDDTLTKRFGDKVRRYRLRHGFSQEELAYRAGLHRTQITLIERGKRSPRLETICKLAAALDVKPARLIPE